MKLVEGKYYKRRDGVVVGPAEQLPHENLRGFDWFVGGFTYNERGEFSFSMNERDLTLEVERPVRNGVRLDRAGK